MKKWMKWFCASLIALVAVLSVSCNKHEYNPKVADDIATEDSAWFVTMVNMQNNPKFAGVSDVCKYQREAGKIRYQDSVFFSIPQTVLTKVAQVLSYKKVPLTKSNIVNEFSDGKDIYLNLDKIEEYKSMPPDGNCDSLDYSDND